ncbi:uncharacterized protein [Chelonus insularis]|uniref:uncharacterized protein isoform X2 n=1 Tax=Chelonus insularis TaxID=460826 RepID=UPI00158E7D71|nr:uncharacterized protein LOC118074654 isoform X2 [Chelonus insularis]
MWLKILRQNISHLARRARGSTSIDQKNGNTKNNKTNNNNAELNRNEENGNNDIKNQAKKKTGGPGSGPLLQQAEVSSSQLDFFRMLDEKIENGPDYDESLDATVRAERISDLLRRWELASMTWSSVTDLNAASGTALMGTNVLEDSRHTLSAKDREGMRNIIGGRPESAPVFTRNANRVDGLQEIHCPSPNMPRHVLESISQSPTQSVKNSTPPGSSPTSLRFQEYREDNANLMNTSRMTRADYQPHHQISGQVNGEYVTQQALYREQYLQQTGIIAMQPQYQSGNVLRTNSYVQQFQMTPRKRGFNAAQMT